MLTVDPEIIDIEGNTLKNFSLNANESKTLNLTCNKNRNNYVSFLSLDNLKFNLESNIDELDSKDQTLNEIEVKNIEGDYLQIKITSEKDNRIEIINIIDNETSSYFEIKTDDQKFEKKKLQFSEIFRKQR